MAISFAWVPGTTGANKEVKILNIWNLSVYTDVKDLVFKCVTKALNEVLDAAHALVGNAVV